MLSVDFISLFIFVIAMSVLITCEILTTRMAVLREKAEIMHICEKYGMTMKELKEYEWN